MKIPGIALLAIGGGIIYYFSQLGVAGATVNFVFNGINFKSLSSLGVTIMVQNVSNATLNLNALSADISLNGDYIGNAAFFPVTPAQIAPTSQMPVELTVNLSLLSLPGTIRDLIEHPTSQFTALVKGNANINNLVIPFSVDQTVSI